MSDPKGIHVLVIGAGVVGAALGQGLRKAGISFTIFDRDEHVQSRGQGWGITIHWALPALYGLLPEHLLPLIRASQIDPSTDGPQECGMTALDASTGAVRYRMPPGQKRLRVRRERFRAAMVSDLNVQWNKKLYSFASTDSGVIATFTDGSTASGTILIGADGSGSEVRRTLAPETHALNQLPVRCLGMSVRFTHSQIADVLKIDPMVFMATHPVTHDFLWWSLLESPEDLEKGLYTALVALVWLVRSGEDEVQGTSREQVQRIKHRVDCFAEPMKSVVHAIPDETVPFEIKIADWEWVEWERCGGRATLVGDAAHAMTMFRGDAANHGILDASNIVKALQKVISGEAGLEEVIGEYDVEVKARCRPSVLGSRQACFDALMIDRPVDGSPLLEVGTGPLDKTRRWNPQE